MTKEYLLSKTLYGVDIIQHLIRKEFPDFVMRVSGTDCGQCPDPVWADGSIIEVTMDRIPVEGRRLLSRARGGSHPRTAHRPSGGRTLQQGAPEAILPRRRAGAAGNSGAGKADSPALSPDELLPASHPQHQALP